MINSTESILPQNRINQTENIIQNSTLTANNGIMRVDDTHFLIEVTSEELGILQEKRLNRSVQIMPEIMPRKEAEKEISRLDKDVSEIKTDIKEIKSEIKDIKSQMNNFVTKTYLNTEFRPALINELQLHQQKEEKITRRWIIGIGISILLPLIKLILFKS